MRRGEDAAKWALEMRVKDREKDSALLLAELLLSRLFISMLSEAIEGWGDVQFAPYQKYADDVKSNSLLLDAFWNRQISGGGVGGRRENADYKAPCFDPVPQFALSSQLGNVI